MVTEIKYFNSSRMMKLPSESKPIATTPAAKFYPIIDPKKFNKSYRITKLPPASKPIATTPAAKFYPIIDPKKFNKHSRIVKIPSAFPEKIQLPEPKVCSGSERLLTSFAIGGTRESRRAAAYFAAFLIGSATFLAGAKAISNSLQRHFYGTDPLTLKPD